MTRKTILNERLFEVISQISILIKRFEGIFEHFFKVKFLLISQI